MYYPDFKIGIEYNGSIYHATINTCFGNKNKYYHRNKFLQARKQGIHLISIFDVDWETNRKKIIQYLRFLFCKKIELFVDKCIIRKIDKNIANTFCNEYCLKESDDFSFINYGLYYNNELISVMCFDMLKLGSYELRRYCIKDGLIILSGVKKMLSQFIEDHRPRHIIGYSDNDYYSGKEYEQLGFADSGQCALNYYWYYHNKELKQESCDINILKTEHSCLYEEAMQNKVTNVEEYIMSRLGACKVYRSGRTKWEMFLT